jgi:hypothetical protein
MFIIEGDLKPGQNTTENAQPAMHIFFASEQHEGVARQLLVASALGAIARKRLSGDEAYQLSGQAFAYENIIIPRALAHVVFSVFDAGHYKQNLDARSRELFDGTFTTRQKADELALIKNPAHQSPPWQWTTPDGHIAHYKAGKVVPYSQPITNETMLMHDLDSVADIAALPDAHLSYVLPLSYVNGYPILQSEQYNLQLSTPGKGGGLDPIVTVLDHTHPAIQ